MVNGEGKEYYECFFKKFLKLFDLFYMGQHSPPNALELCLALSNKLRLLLVFFSPPNIDVILQKTQTGTDIQRKLITACLMPHGIIRRMIRELTTHFAEAPLGYV